VDHGGFFHASLALAIGLAAQVLATRFGIPSIVLLLGAGVAAGPDGLGILLPAALGDGIAPLVTLAVTVILFEGGLALRLEELRAQQRSLSLLLTLGAAVSFVIGTLAAALLLGLPWRIAGLYGALMIVTGPTVVTPMLARIPLARRVRELLIGEGVLIDPIGAIIAIVAAEYVVGHYQAWEMGGLVFLRLGIGGAIGGIVGLLVAVALRRNWIPELMRNPVVLASALTAAAVASRISSEAGLMSAVVQGVVMGNIGLRGLGALRQFKEEMTILLLSFIFVLLAADLRLAAIAEIGFASLAVVTAVIWVARPLAVFASTLGSDLSLRERIFVAWVCPRGIVAVSVAGLFAFELDAAGIAGGDALEALVFVTVAVTVLLQGTTAASVAAALGIDRPVHQGTIIVGANELGLLLARLLKQLDRQVALVDTNPRLAQRARDACLAVFEGDARSIETLEVSGAQYAYALLAVTSNSELNIVVRDRVHANFRVDRVLAVSGEPEGDAASLPFPGSFPGVDEVNRQLRLKKARLAAYHVARADAPEVDLLLRKLPWTANEFALLLVRRGSVYVASASQVLQVDDVLVCLEAGAGDSRLAADLVRIGAASTGSDGSMVEALGLNRFTGSRGPSATA
jgi:NhaP-type Na+/H+ or K+/H+ antiporter